MAGAPILITCILTTMVKLLYFWTGDTNVEGPLALDIMDRPLQTAWYMRY